MCISLAKHLVTELDTTENFAFLLEFLIIFQCIKNLADNTDFSEVMRILYLLVLI